jgi:hypothetical protein
MLPCIFDLDKHAALKNLIFLTDATAAVMVGTVPVLTENANQQHLHEPGSAASPLSISFESS